MLRCSGGMVVLSLHYPAQKEWGGFALHLAVLMEVSSSGSVRGPHASCQCVPGETLKPPLPGTSTI